MTDKSLITQIILHNPDLSTNKIIQLFGLKRLHETMSIQELQQMFTKHNKRSLQRLLVDARRLAVPTKEDSLDVIHKQVTKGKTVRL